MLITNSDDDESVLDHVDHVEVDHVEQLDGVVAGRGGQGAVPRCTDASDGVRMGEESLDELNPGARFLPIKPCQNLAKTLKAQ
jgi:hypothetical protein